MREPRVLLPAVIGLLAMIGAASPLTAQGCCSVELRGGHVWPHGRALESVEESTRFGTTVAVGFGSGVAIGLGGAVSTAPLSIRGEYEAELGTVFAEGRYRFGTGREGSPRLVPFLGARLGWVEAELRDSRQAYYSNGGVLVGGRVGLEAWVTQQVAMMGGADYEFITVGDEGIVHIPEIENSGRSFGLWAGLKMAF